VHRHRSCLFFVARNVRGRVPSQCAPNSGGRELAEAASAVNVLRRGLRSPRAAVVASEGRVPFFHRGASFRGRGPRGACVGQSRFDQAGATARRDRQSAGRRQIEACSQAHSEPLDCRNANRAREANKIKQQINVRRRKEAPQAKPGAAVPELRSGSEPDRSRPGDGLGARSSTASARVWRSKAAPRDSLGSG